MKIKTDKNMDIASANFRNGDILSEEQYLRYKDFLKNVDTYKYRYKLNKIINVRSMKYKYINYYISLFFRLNPKMANDYIFIDPVSQMRYLRRYAGVRNRFLKLNGPKPHLIEYYHAKYYIKLYEDDLAKRNTKENIPKTVVVTKNRKPKNFEVLVLEKKRLFLEKLKNKFGIEEKDASAFVDSMAKYLYYHKKVSRVLNHYFYFLKYDDYCKMFYSKKSNIRIMFKGNKTLQTLANAETPLEYFDDLDNYIIYSVTNTREKPVIYTRTNFSEKLVNYIEYEESIDELSTCKFNGSSLEEIISNMNNRGFLQGTFKPRNPKKYVKNPLEFQRLILPYKEKREYFVQSVTLDIQNNVNVSTGISVTKYKSPIKESEQQAGFFSKFKGNKIVYRSSLELMAFNFLDTCSEILAWSSESVIVPYVKPTLKEDSELDTDKINIHKYFVDLWVLIKQPNGELKSFLIEIKPKKQCFKPRKTAKKSDKTYITEMLTYAVNQAKWNAARKFAKSHNMTFIIWTEKDLAL